MPETNCNGTKWRYSMITLILGALLQSYAIFKLWNWFIAPLGVPVISMSHALGLMAFTFVLLGTRGLDNNSNDFNNYNIEVIIVVVGVPLTGLTIGFIAHYLMRYNF